MGQRGGDRLRDYFLLLADRANLLSDFSLKFSVVDVNVLCSVLFQPFYVLAGEEDLKAVDGHREEDDPRHSCIFGLEFSVGYDFLITEEIELSHFVALVI